MVHFSTNIYNRGYSRGECASILGLRPSTITNYVRLYNEGGLPLLSRLNFKKPESKLMAYKEKISRAINELLPDCIAAIREWIRQEFGIERSLQRVRVFIKNLGFRYSSLLLVVREKRLNSK